MKHLVVAGVIGAAAVVLAGCGSNNEERSATGAGTGALVGGLVGGPIGLAVGAGVGGVAGNQEKNAEEQGAKLMNDHKADSTAGEASAEPSRSGQTAEATTTKKHRRTGHKSSKTTQHSQGTPGSTPPDQSTAPAPSSTPSQPGGDNTAPPQ